MQHVQRFGQESLTRVKAQVTLQLEDLWGLKYGVILEKDGKASTVDRGALAEPAEQDVADTVVLQKLMDMVIEDFGVTAGVLLRQYYSSSNTPAVKFSGPHAKCSCILPSGCGAIQPHSSRIFPALTHPHILRRPPHWLQVRGRMQIPPRAQFVDRVRAALAAPFGPALYLHGAASTGKDATLGAAVGQGTTIRVDCVLSHTERLLFSEIAPDAKFAITSASDLIDTLATQTSNASTLQPSTFTVIVLNRAERLASSAFPPTTLPLIADLPSLSKRPDLRIVLVSRVPLGVVRHTHSQLVPNMCAIYFAPLSREEINQALTFDSSRLKYTSDIISSTDGALVSKYYRGFAEFVVNILYQSTNNPHHIQRVVDAFFPEYLVLLLEKSNKLEPMAAFNRVRDRLTDVLKTLNPTLSSEATLATQGPLAAKTSETNVKTANLSRGCRTMLVAAYLGTVIQPGQDTRIFSTERTNRRMTAQKKAASNSVPLERLLAIFQAVSTIDEDRPSFLTQSSSFRIDTTVVSSAISTFDLVHISTLTALGWLVRDGAAHSLSEPKFRCRLSRQDAGLIARTVGIQLEDYLIFDKVA